MDLQPEIEQILEAGGPRATVLDSVLSAILRQMDCVVGTIHVWDESAKLLLLEARKGIPEKLLDRVQRIPIGKGMAGIAAERREPVQVCNLQVDSSGVAKPAARETGVEGSIAVPMLVGDHLCGVLGIAKSSEHEFTEPEKTLLLKIGQVLGTHLREA